MLHELVARHAQTMLAELRDADPEGGGLPRYVERELAAYLRCGVLAHGFTRVRCQSCHDEVVVAFSASRTEAVMFVQRFGGLVNLNVHFHVVVPDGVFVENEDGGLEFVMNAATRRSHARMILAVTRSAESIAITRSQSDRETPSIERPIAKNCVGNDLNSVDAQGNSSLLVMRLRVQS